MIAARNEKAKPACIEQAMCAGSHFVQSRLSIALAGGLTLFLLTLCAEAVVRLFRRLCNSDREIPNMTSTNRMSD